MANDKFGSFCYDGTDSYVEDVKVFQQGWVVRNSGYTQGFGDVDDLWIEIHRKGSEKKIKEEAEHRRINFEVASY